MFCRTSTLYGPDSAYCYTPIPLGAGPTYDMVMVLESSHVGIPPVITFISFLICTTKLASSSPTEAAKQRNKRAAVTVTMFTGLFLLCNLPFSRSLPGAGMLSQ